MRKFIVVSAIGLMLTASVYAQSGGCVAIGFSSEQKQRGQFDVSFSATQVADVDMSVLFSPGAAQRFANGDHVIEIRVFTPNGHLYRSISVPVTTDSKRNGQMQKVGTYPRPIKTVLLQQRSFGGQPQMAATVRLPVGGTTITTASLYGQWSAQAFVDGEELACSGAAKFTLTQ